MVGRLVEHLSHDVNPEHFIIAREATRLPPGQREGHAYCDESRCESFRGLAPFTQDGESYPGIHALSAFEEKYWWVEIPPLDFRMQDFRIQPASIAERTAHQHRIVSTEALEMILDTGATAFICGGPFETREAATYALDVDWEAPE